MIPLGDALPDTGGALPNAGGACGRGPVRGTHPGGAEGIGGAAGAGGGVPPPAPAALPGAGYFTPSRSTTKISVSLGLMAPPAPRWP